MCNPKYHRLFSLLFLLLALLPLSGCLFYWGESKSFKDLNEAQIEVLGDILDFPLPADMSIEKCQYSSVHETILEIEATYSHEAFRQYIEKLEDDNIEEVSSTRYRVLSTNVEISLVTQYGKENREYVRIMAFDCDIDYERFLNAK